MSVTDRIFVLLKQQGKAQKELANFLRTGTSTIAGWKHENRNPSINMLIPICEFLSISPEFLLTGVEGGILSENEDSIIALYEAANEQARQTALAALKYGQVERPSNVVAFPHKTSSSFIEIKNPSEKEGVLVPIVGKTAAGFPLEMIEEDYGEVPISERRIRPGDFGVIASGDSMVNANIHDGDVVIIRPQPVVDNGEIALVSVEDGSTIKKVYVYPDRIELVPMNDNHPKQVFDLDDDIRILGKVITTIL